MIKKTSTLFALCVSLVLGLQPSGRPVRQLRFVVMLMRHGVRSPTWTAEQLNQYSSQPWPVWGVPPGYLTAHGRALIKLFGDYDREYFTEAGLFSSDCRDAGRVYIWADTDQRTLETGRALARSLLPGCTAVVHAEPNGKRDALFSAPQARNGIPDGKQAAAAILGRLGGRPEALIEAYRPAFDTMQRVLLGPGDATPEIKAPKKSLLDLPASVEPNSDHLADLRGPLNIASSLAETFFLEYANGFKGSDLGWGRLNESNLREIMALHTAYADLARATPYIARARGSNLLSHIETSMAQAAKGESKPGAMGAPDNRLLIIVGHDANITNLAGMLGLSWLIPGYQRDDTPPGGALVFELWCTSQNQSCIVKTYYTSPTLGQLHQTLPLTANSPPAKAKVFVPGCSSSMADFACDWTDFERTLKNAIDPALVVN